MRPLLVSIFALSVIGVVGCTPKPQPKAEPTPVARPAFDPTAVFKEIATLTQSVKTDPQGAIAFGMLSHTYLKAYRQTGDIQQAVLAEQSAQKSLSLRTRRNETAYLRLAQSQIAQHKFSEAMASAKKALALLPDFQEAGLLASEIALERGDYQTAETYWRKYHPAPSTPTSKALEARMLWINGAPEKALSAYKEALSAAESAASIDNETLAWFYGKVGECFENTGKTAEAEIHYQKALALFPTDHRILNAMTRLKTTQQDWQGVLEWGKRSAAVVPSPETIGYLGDAYRALGDKKQAERQYSLLDNMSRFAQSIGSTYDRQRALFLADHGRHLEEALRLAQAELKIRQDVYAYDILAWCLFKNGRTPEAKAAMKRALARGTKEPRFLAHAAQIEGKTP
jgi:tetratricopeptide (TPR) repeat protein